MPHSTRTEMNGSSTSDFDDAPKHYTSSKTSNGTKGFTEPIYSPEGVKEAPFYSGRGRALRVVCIGAGAAGIYLGIKLPRSFRDGAVDLQIYEKNPKFSGCWYENTYPGCACDIPSQVYSYSFAPNPDWSHFYSSSAEIQAYFEGVAIRYGVPKYVKLEHKVVSAIWNEQLGQWALKIERLEDGAVIEDFADVLVNASGILNAWKWPDIAGLHSFKGPLLHSAKWDHSVEFDKTTTVGVIGNGSSAIQIVPKLVPLVKKLDTFIRTKTWIALPFTSGKVASAAVSKDATLDPTAALVDPQTSNPAYTDAERKRFRDDPAYLARYRWEIEHENNARFTLTTRKDSEGAMAAIPKLAAIMKARLARKPELADLLIPDWHVGCRRLTPGVGYLEALCEDNVSVVTSSIQRVVAEGIITADGVLHPLDVLVCATGFDVSTRPHFDVVGRDGYVFTHEWAKSPKGYLTLAMSNMPNYFLFNGPNAPVANGSLIPAMEAEGDYIIKMVDKLLREDIRSVCVKKEAEQAFVDYTDAWMPRTIWKSGCRSWYKGGTVDGRVSGVWPGSILHFMALLKNPRFEDYTYTYLNDQSPFAFLGNGYTLADVDPEADKASYLHGAGIAV
ncbi:hypothetical protein BCR35DRAFT_323518 [Leucosporidium creatinivorum]|uniref:FAD/NAD(P)-binding domain-containing protein n=1 Tax=Leucosporidium creatinivorum TaxID=106004 RepID=A0A1Y2G1G0_9BASI|nr:hypothetical protein BCR35DRAFT_323518 [Leucosporidium creatinivorum]